LFCRQLDKLVDISQTVFQPEVAMNIRQRLTLLIALTFAALLLIGGFAVFQSRGSSTEVKTVTEGVVPSALASVELMSQLKDVQIAALASVSATDAVDISKTQIELSSKKESLQRALRLQFDQADSDAQRGLIKQAEESLSNYFGSIDDTVKFKLAGQQEMAEANMSATVDQYLREQISIIETVQIEKRRSKDEAIASVNRNMEQTTTALTMITLGAVIGLGGLGLILYRQITRPIADMQEKMTEIATSQDFTHRVPVTRQDEIGRSIVAFNAMIEKIQESSEVVKQKNADIHAMLHNIPQGILTVVPGSTVHPEYSAYLETILETTDIADRSVMELVFTNTRCGSDILSQVETAMSACIGEDSMNFDFNAHLLVHEIEKDMADGRTKILDLSWSPITDDADTVVRLMLCIWDVTQLRQLELQAKEQKRELAVIGEILAVNQEKFHAFIDGARRFVSENESLLKQSGDAPTAVTSPEVIAGLFRNMHTIKGNARTYGLLHLTNLVHEAEQTYDDMRKAPDTPWDLMLMISQLESVAAELDKYDHINNVKLGRKGPGRRGGVDKFLMVPKERIEFAIAAIDRAADSSAVDQMQTLKDLRQAMYMLGTEKVESVLSGVIDSLPSLAIELGKEAPITTIDDQGIVVRAQATDLLKNIFMHLYRNSMDHGIEDAYQRTAAGKSPRGRIHLVLNMLDDALTLRLSDDGRGLAVGFIRKKAIESGIITQDQHLSPEETAQLIFEGGFSTAAVVTEVSGRGVGMDAVRGFVEAEGGTIALRFTSDVDSDEFRPFETVITLPAKYAIRAEVHV